MTECTITIEVKGQPGTGKSTAIRIMRAALEASGRFKIVHTQHFHEGHKIVLHVELLHD